MKVDLKDYEKIKNFLDEMEIPYREGDYYNSSAISDEDIIGHWLTIDVEIETDT